MASPRAPDFQGLIARVARALEGRGIPFMLIGGQAVLLHGEPRLTQDVDVTLGVGPDRLDDLLAVADEASLSPLPEDAATFVRDTFVLPCEEPATGLRVDFIFSTTPYEAEAIQRAVRVEIAREEVPFASAEDLLLHKLFAGRPRDLEDAAGVIRRKGAGIDWGYVRGWAERLAEIPGREGMPDQVDRLRRGDA